MGGAARSSARLGLWHREIFPLIPHDCLSAAHRMRLKLRRTRRSRLSLLVGVDGHVCLILAISATLSHSIACSYSLLAGKDGRSRTPHSGGTRSPKDGAFRTGATRTRSAVHLGGRLPPGGKAGVPRMDPRVDSIKWGRHPTPISPSLCASDWRPVGATTAATQPRAPALLLPHLQRPPTTSSLTSLWRSLRSEGCIGSRSSWTSACVRLQGTAGPSGGGATAPPPPPPRAPRLPPCRTISAATTRGPCSRGSTTTPRGARWSTPPLWRPRSRSSLATSSKR